jgi:DNA-binding NarL/FixJ family response regulator
MRSEADRIVHVESIALNRELELFVNRELAAQAHVDGRVERRIQAVDSGPRQVTPGICRRVPLTSLSPREMEILILVAKGKSNKEIGTELAISEGTVRVHASNLLSKLHCSGRAQAVTEAIRRGIIEVE